MCAQYLHHLPLPQTWGCEYRDWVHPKHGPLPDLLGLVLGAGEQFQVALWVADNCLVLALEQLDRARTDEETEQAASMRGWILMTQCWKPTKKGFTYMDREVIVPPPVPRATDELTQEEWRTHVFQAVMTEAVDIATKLPMGSVPDWISHINYSHA